VILGDRSAARSAGTRPGRAGHQTPIREFSIGTFRENSSGTDNVHLDPAPYSPRKSRVRREHLLGEFARRVADHNVGGSHARPIMTAYRQDALRCAHCLANNGPLRAVAVRRHTCVANAARILQRNVYGWFERVERGVYRLTPRGGTALDSFSEILTAIIASDGAAEPAANGTGVTPHDVCTASPQPNSGSH
jgi:hypothetical protein